MIHRWLTLWALRRAYRVLFLDTGGRPLRQRLAREAKRVVVAAAVIVALLLALIVAVIVVLVQSLV